MTESQNRRTRLKIGMVLLLACTAGWVDAVGFLVLLRLFIAHMSGNSIAMTVYLGEANWKEAIHRGFPIPLFLLGITLGTVLNEMLWRRAARSIFAGSLILEALLLAAFALLGGPLLEHGSLPLDPWWKFYPLAALPVLAMGLQNATLKRVAGQKVRTTYISGVLTDAVEEFVRYVFQRRDRSAGREFSGQDLPGPPPSGAGILLLGSLWLAYATGGLLGAIAELHWRLPCLAAPIGCLLFVAACDLASPLESRAKD